MIKKSLRTQSLNSFPRCGFRHILCARKCAFDTNRLSDN